MAVVESELYAPVARRSGQSFLALDVPLMKATPESLKDYGRIETSYEAAVIDIVPWPQPGWRPLDPGTGNEGGIVQGTFEFWWEGEVMRGRNNAVGGDYIIGWSTDPELASESAVAVDRTAVFLGHANYHPDGGQLFFPRDGAPFVIPLALPGDGVKPEDFVAFYCDGSFGVNIHPGIWHEAVFPLAERAVFDGKQGKVHARISCNIAKEFGVYLKVPLQRP